MRDCRQHMKQSWFSRFGCLIRLIIFGRRRICTWMCQSMVSLAGHSKISRLFGRTDNKAWIQLRKDLDKHPPWFGTQRTVQNWNGTGLKLVQLIEGLDQSWGSSILEEMRTKGKATRVTKIGPCSNRWVSLINQDRLMFCQLISSISICVEIVPESVAGC